MLCNQLLQRAFNAGISAILAGKIIGTMQHIGKNN